MPPARRPTRPVPACPGRESALPSGSWSPGRAEPSRSRSAAAARRARAELCRGAAGSGRAWPPISRTRGRPEAKPGPHRQTAPYRPLAAELLPGARRQQPRCERGCWGTTGNRRPSPPARGCEERNALPPSDVCLDPGGALFDTPTPTQEKLINKSNYC